MTFETILNQATEMVQRRGRVSYRALKRQFNLDDSTLADLTFELIEVKKVAADEEGVMLKWIAGRDGSPTPGAEPTSPPAESVQKSRELAAERRQLTVMFIDLVGSTELSRRLDPEDLREILHAYQDLFESVITPYHGKVIQHAGDGIVAFFGYPKAHEDDARQAVMAGLAMLTAMEDLDRKYTQELDVSLQARIGLHTGMVVVGTTGGKEHSEFTAIGEAPNLTSRIQGVAEPNTMVISAATNKLIRGYFETSSYGEFSLKGFNEPIELHRVGHEKDRDLFSLSAEDNLKPFVGREHELKQLMNRWQMVHQSQGQVVLVSGEAGIGKSRLVRAAVSEIAHGDTPVITFRCSPYQRNTSFHPIIESIQHELKHYWFDGHESELDRLEAYLHSRNLERAQDIALCAALLSIPTLDRFEDLNVSAELRKTMTIACLVRWLLGDDTPSLIVIEDLHWADPSTLELLDYIIRKTQDAQVLFIATFRPDFIPPWEDHAYLTRIIVNPLTREESELMIHRLAHKLPPVVMHDLLTKTDGNPLFVEEVTKLVIESGVLKQKKGKYKLKGSLKSLAIPNTLKDSLMARLDRLGEAKEVAQIGATIGRVFSYALIKPISQMSESVLNDHLEQLINAGMLFMNGEIPEAQFTFKHALIQETAYESLLKKSRPEIHARIVQTLEDNLAGTVDSNPELLAHHCTEAGLLARAVPYWKHAGDRALSRSAHAEAINHLNEGLLVLSHLPESEQRTHDEILFQIALGVPLTALRGYGSPEVEEAYGRARTLCQQAGDTGQLVPALYGLWRYYLLRADYTEARQLCDELLSLADRNLDPEHREMANRAAGSTSVYLGELDTARMHLEQIIPVADPDQQHDETLFYAVVDVWVTAHSYLSWTLWLQGNPDRALEHSRIAIKLAKKLNHPFSLALAQCFAAWLHQFRGEKTETNKHASEGLVIAKENGFTFWIGWASLLESWARDGKDTKDQLTQMRAGLETWRETGSELGSSYFLYLLSERLMADGDIKAAWQALAEAKEFVHKTGERLWEAELLRLEGMLHLAGITPATQKAEHCFRRALQIASDQKAKALELRAATSLARLLSNSARHEEGYRLLHERIEWFDEGLTLTDLVEAREVLNNIPQVQQNVSGKS